MNHKGIVLGVLCLLMLVGFANATYPNVSIKITNNQGSSTGSNFQALINLTACGSLCTANMSADGGNIRFKSGSSSLYSWRENVTYIWVLLPSGIGANSNTIINMTFLSTSTNYDGVYAGEAPQLSASYGQYDNAKSVFGFYENFAGTSFPSTMLYNTSYGATAPTVNDGITLNAGSGITAMRTITTYSTPSIVETLSNTAETGSYLAMRVGFSPTPQAPYCSLGANYGVGYLIDTYGGIRLQWQTACTTGGVIQANANHYPAGSIYSVAWYSGGQQSFVNYKDYMTGSDTQIALAPSYPYFGLGDFGAIGTWSLQWVRTRAYPPSGVMPSVAFSSPIIPSSETLTITPNPSVYGQLPISLTATCTPSGDTCSVEYPFGTALCTGTGSCSYSIPIGNPQNVGSYTYYANDITLNQHTSNSLVVNKDTLSVTLGNACSTYEEIPYSCYTQGYYTTATGNIILATQQVTGNLWVNGQIVNTTDTTHSLVSNTIANQIGTFVYVFNVLGTSNYNSATGTLTWYGYLPLILNNASSRIVQSPPSNTLTGWTYPYRLSTTASSGITVSLTKSYNGGANTILYTNVANFSYVPPANDATGTYVYTFTETEGATSTTWSQIFAPMNMMSINAITYTLPNIQFLQNQAFPKFVSLPVHSFSIQSDNPLNQYTAGTCTSNTQGCSTTFSNINMTFTPRWTLCYTGFPCFLANLTDNPAMQPITQAAFNVVRSSSPPYTREIMNVSTFDMQFATTLNATTHYGFGLQVNNYAIVNSSAYTGNTFKIYVAQSNYNNPVLKVMNSSFYSTATAHSSVQNNFFNADINVTVPQTYDIYLPNINNDTAYTINIQQCITSGALGDFLLVKEGQGTLYQVQSYKIGTSPFPLYFQIQTPYQFSIWSPSKVNLYTGVSGIPSTSITIQLSCQQNVPNQTNPNANAKCILVNPSNTLIYKVYCAGNDTRNYVQDWNINVLWKQSLTQTSIVNKTIVLGPSFLFNWTVPNLTRTYGVSVCYQLGGVNSSCVPVTYLSVIVNPSSPFNITIAIYGILLFVGVTMISFQTKTVHLIAGIGVIFFGTIIGIYNFGSDAFIGTMIVVIMCIFILMYKKGH